MKGTGHLKEIEMIVKGKNVNLWIFHISAGEFCDGDQKALLSLQRQAVIVFSQAIGKYYIARLETATAQIIAVGYKIRITRLAGRLSLTTTVLKKGEEGISGKSSEVQE